MTPDNQTPDNQTADRQTPVAELLAALCDRPLSSAEMRQLDELVCTDAEARRLYVEYLDLHARLVWQFHRVAGATTPGICLPLHGSSFITHSFLSGGVLFSYLFAAVLLGAGTLAAFLAFGASGNRDAASNVPSLSKTVPAADAQQAPIVGYVTNVPNCKWVGSGTGVTLASAVFLGQTFALASGSLEITYSTGERVVLHGPASYEARWFNGGFLAQGRLTAHAIAATTVERAQMEQVAKQWREIYLKMRTSPQAPGSNSASSDLIASFNTPKFRFFIRTPSTLAISRGAEFSVSVDDTGATNTRLTAGLIEAWYPRGGKPNDVISSSAHAAWSWAAFTLQHDVRVMYGTGKPPGLLRTALAGTPGGIWPRAVGGGGSLQIWGLESRQPRATAGILPGDQRGRTTN